MAERLSPEREQEIRAARYQVRALSAADVDIDGLLTEIDRLRKELDAVQRRYTEDTAELKRQIAGLDDLRLRAIDKGDALRAQLAKAERDNPAAAITHDCGIPLTRRLDCGHCPHEICQDCDHCPHTCRCAEGGDLR